MGDWNGDGRTKTGVFRNRMWILDYNGDGVVNYANLGPDKVFQYTASPGDIPVLGDWNGGGRTKTGIFATIRRAHSPQWNLDFNGDGVVNYSNLGVEKVTSATGDVPITGKW